MTTKTNLEKLKEVRAFFEDKSNWTMYVSFRDKNTKEPLLVAEGTGSIEERQARNLNSRRESGTLQCCFTGALKLFGVEPITFERILLRNTGRELYGEGLVDINDLKGHDAVLATLDETIKRLET